MPPAPSHASHLAKEPLPKQGGGAQELNGKDAETGYHTSNELCKTSKEVEGIVDWGRRLEFRNKLDEGF